MPDNRPSLQSMTIKTFEHRRSAMRPLHNSSYSVHTGSHSVHKRSHSVSFFLSLLVTCCFATSSHAENTATKSGNWSDQSTWADGAVPTQGDVVTIAQGIDVVLDVSPPALNGMTISGKLRFADNS